MITILEFIEHHRHIWFVLFFYLLIIRFRLTRTIRVHYHLDIIVAWYDIWFGVFIDRTLQFIYILPIPMFGIRIYYGGQPE